MLTRFQKFSGAISALTNPLTYIVVNLAIVWLIHTGAIRVNMGTLTQGEVVALYNYMTQILVELIKFANLIVTITKSVACGNRIQSVLEIVPSQKDTKSVPPQKTAFCDAPKISFEHVSFTYKNGGRESISDITFSCSAGETVGIIGGTGSGKSTLVHMIPRFYDATSGIVSVDGINVCDYPMEELRAKSAL